jgi:hypothetical protein
VLARGNDVVGPISLTAPADRVRCRLDGRLIALDQLTEQRELPCLGKLLEARQLRLDAGGRCRRIAATVPGWGAVGGSTVVPVEVYDPTTYQDRTWEYSIMVTIITVICLAILGARGDRQPVPGLVCARPGVRDYIRGLRRGDGAWPTAGLATAL